jgi:hypothetical protein
VGFFERDFERDHLAEKRNRTRMGQKIHCASVAVLKLQHNFFWFPTEKKGFQEDAQFCTILATDFLKIMTWEATKAPCQKKYLKIRFLSPPSVTLWLI